MGNMVNKIVNLSNEINDYVIPGTTPRIPDYNFDWDAYQIKRKKRNKWILRIFTFSFVYGLIVLTFGYLLAIGVV